MSDCEQMEFQLSTSSLAASPAKTFRQPVAALELKVSVRDYGLKFAALLASYDPYTQSWKTSGTSLLARTTNQADGSDVFSATWPRSGMMRNGIAYQLRDLHLDAPCLADLFARGNCPDIRKDARLSGAVDRIGAVGNTVQVQIPQLIATAILRCEREKREAAL